MTTLKETLTWTLKYFTLDEFNCKETGENKMSHNCPHACLIRLREECDCSALFSHKVGSTEALSTP
jgi:hypothetical protein